MPSHIAVLLAAWGAENQFAVASLIDVVFHHISVVVVDVEMLVVVLVGAMVIHMAAPIVVLDLPIREYDVLFVTFL